MSGPSDLAELQLCGISQAGLQSIQLGPDCANTRQLLRDKSAAASHPRVTIVYASCVLAAEAHIPLIRPLFKLGLLLCSARSRSRSLAQD